MSPERPFTYLKRGNPDFDDEETDREKQLKVLGLTIESSTGDVRRVAVSMRAQMREKGLNVESVKALKYALERTNDCQDERQFLWFLLDGYSFEEIKSSRSW